MSKTNEALKNTEELPKRKKETTKLGDSILKNLRRLLKKHLDRDKKG